MFSFQFEFQIEIQNVFISIWISNWNPKCFHFNLNFKLKSSLQNVMPFPVSIVGIDHAGSSVLRMAQESSRCKLATVFQTNTLQGENDILEPDVYPQGATWAEQLSDRLQDLWGNCHGTGRNKWKKLCCVVLAGPLHMRPRVVLAASYTRGPITSFFKNHSLSSFIPCQASCLSC